ncbi:copper resistance CopC/CopD family protein [Blastococcus goldschmidtiae]|uniref:Copper resistance protein CopC n=1 Tax=Blastococcus goldschmidtiae TaxID=3075546 RepID=A0ABU2KE41_9ACTN|nr:copper resistance protein CopC [Blastococcus sp. DSM 46792]MDT0278427.1 copper resistance protein CopC [Blastococcus sp. DSM 46792]
MTALRSRRGLSLLLLLAGWLLAGVVLAGPASAHAVLVSTEPGESARLDTPPTEVTLRFSEGVSLGAGYARVLTADGTRVDTDEASVDGDTLTIPLDPELADGGYLVTYRIVSADSHPVQGAWSFVVGDGDLVAASAVDESSDRLVEGAQQLVRTVGFGGIALAIGVPVLVLLCLPGGWSSPRLRAMSTWGAGAAAGTAVLAFLLQGPYAAGSGFASLLDPDLLSATAATSTGWALLARAVLAVGLLAALHPVWRRASPPEPPELVAAGVCAVGLVVATAATGHAMAGQWPVLAVAVTAVHVAAMAVWLGGLVALLLVVLRPFDEDRDFAGALRAFSRLAFAAVAALVVTGVLQTVRELGSPTALVDTVYGRLLMAKLTFFLVVLGAAGVSRVWVQQRLGVRRAPAGRRSRVPALAAVGSAGADLSDDESVAARDRLRTESAAEQLPSLRRSLIVEAVLGAAIVLVSAVLVGTPPGQAIQADPVDVTIPLEGGAGDAGSVQMTVAPAQAGTNVLQLYLYDDEGRAIQPEQIRVSLAEEQQEIGPLDVEIAAAGPGRYVARDMTVPTAGTWRLTVTLRLDEFTATTASTTFPVR